jgi:hypothetical protein
VENRDFSSWILPISDQNVRDSHGDQPERPSRTPPYLQASPPSTNVHDPGSLSTPHPASTSPPQLPDREVFEPRPWRRTKLGLWGVVEGADGDGGKVVWGLVIVMVVVVVAVVTLKVGSGLRLKRSALWALVDRGLVLVFLGHCLESVQAQRLQGCLPQRPGGGVRVSCDRKRVFMIQVLEAGTQFLGMHLSVHQVIAGTSSSDVRPVPLRPACTCI